MRFQRQVKVRRKRRKNNMKQPTVESLKDWFLNQNKQWEKDHPNQDEKDNDEGEES